LTRTPTGIAGLDLVLNGGLEPGSVVVLAGAPGTGKTILAQQMCFAGATSAHKCVYYTTMSEPHTKLVRHLADFAFFDPDALGPTVEYIHMGDFLGPSHQDGLAELTSEIVRKTLDEEPAIVVVDSAKMLGDFVDQGDLRRALYDLTGRFARTETVLLLLGEYAPRSCAATSCSRWPTASSNWSTRPVSRSTDGGCGSSRCAGAATGRASTPSASGPTG